MATALSEVRPRRYLRSGKTMPLAGYAAKSYNFRFVIGVKKRSSQEHDIT